MLLKFRNLSAQNPVYVNSPMIIAIDKTSAKEWNQTFSGRKPAGGKVNLQKEELYKVHHWRRVKATTSLIQYSYLP